MSGNLLIRTDADARIGTGHVMRCLALAQEWKSVGGSAIFAMSRSTPAIDERLQNAGFEIVKFNACDGQNPEELLRLAETREATWIVLDGYHFHPGYQAGLKCGGCRLLIIDDTGNAGEYCADVIVNQNLHAHESMYENRDPHPRLLLGPRYALLRREFDAFRSWEREFPQEARRILVTMGGSDPDNVTLLVIQALREVGMSGREAVVVVGGGNPRFEEVAHAARALGPSVRVQSNVDSMAALMAWADVAVSAAGTSCWELCLLGLPSLLIDLANNQTPIARQMHARGCGFHLGNNKRVSVASIVEKLNWLLTASEVRHEMSQAARKIVDGYGARRVISAMAGNLLQLREAEPGDCRLLWEWVNDPEVRASAFSSAHISWDEHVRWFHSRLRDPQCRIFIGLDQQNRAIGQFRTESAPGREPYIDVSLSREFRGAGYGSRLIELGVERAAAQNHSGRFHAFIKADNYSSRRAFEEAKFRMIGEEILNGSSAIHYVRETVNEAKN